MTGYSRERYRARHPVPTRKCLWCGKSYKAERKLCCSDQCHKERTRERSRLFARKYWQRNQKHKARLIREWRKRNPDRVAKWAKKTWQKVKNDPVLLARKQRSNTLYYERRRRPPLLVLHCECCLRRFKTHRSYQKYCGKPCQMNAEAMRDKVRRKLGLDAYYNSERRREHARKYREAHREDFRRWDRERKQRLETAEYWEDRLRKSNEGEKLWLQRSRLELRKVRRLLKGETRPRKSWHRGQGHHHRTTIRSADVRVDDQPSQRVGHAGESATPPVTQAASC